MVIPGVNDQGWRRDLFYKVGSAWINRGCFVPHPVNSPGDRLERINLAGNERLLLRRRRGPQGRGDVKYRLQTGTGNFLQHPVRKIRAKERLIDPARHRELLLASGERGIWSGREQHERRCSLWIALGEL